MVTMLKILLILMLTLPHQFKPRDYQIPFWNAMKQKKRACKVWHRRSGKDKTDLNFMIKEMVKRVGQYYYYYPTMSYGRKALWEGIDRDGFKFLDHFPKELIAGKPNDLEMRIVFRNGSLFRIVGTDRLEVVGPNPVGCVFSEYSIQHPKGYEYIRPILSENNGWAVFNFTPRGKTHGYRLFRMAQTNPDWFCERLTVDDTHAITQEAIDLERRSGMSEKLILQEYYCSFEGGVEGSYYNDVLNTLFSQGRITNELAYNASLPVHTVCDPGYHWPWLFFQMRGMEPVFIRAYEELGLGVEKHIEILEKLKKEYGYRYGQHFCPIDTEKNNAYKAVAGKSLYEHATENGLNFTVLTPEHRVIEGIERTRQFLFSCWFIKDDCELLLDALDDYSATKIARVSSEVQPVFIDSPATSWSNHLADAMRYASKAIKDGMLNTADVLAKWRQIKDKHR